MLSFLLRQREVFPSFPRRRETRFVLNLWIPALAASAGMTFVCVLMKKLTDTMEDHKFLKIRVIMAALLVATLSACMVVGPDYVRPTVITPDAYKENDGWKVAQPQDDLIRGAIGAVVLVDRLREVSRLQDCLMTRAPNCNDLVEPPKPAGMR